MMLTRFFARSTSRRNPRCPAPALILLGFAVTLVFAPDLAECNETETLHYDAAPLAGDQLDDRPYPLPQSHSRADTVDFGNADATGFAVLDGVWDFDTDLGGGAFQGWYGTDVTANTTAYFRQITEATWSGGGNLVAAPVLAGTGSAWIGAFEDEADELCWQSGLGYGNSWCQRLTSPEFEYSGGGNVALETLYFNDTELNFDYTKVILRRLPSNEEAALNFDGFTDQIGLAPGHPNDPPVGATFNDIINSADLAGETRFRIVFEMTSDGGWSDEDGSYATEYGPFGADDISLTGSLVGGDVAFDFESGLDGWTAAVCPGVGTFLGLNDLSLYNIEDPCQCELAGNVMGFHDDDFGHPDGQRVHARSAPVDVANDVLPILVGDGDLEILGDWDQYSVMPQANGVFYRPGWTYFPFECAHNPTPSWSDRVGQNNFFFVGEQPVCTDIVNSATQNGIPQETEQIRFLYEVYASCDAFGIDPEVCTNVTNFTPLIDNIRIRFTRIPAAPTISYDPGTQYQDGFSQSLVNDPHVHGRADITNNVNFGNSAPFVLGDSLFLSGPLPGSGTEWEAKLWFRVRREGPSSQDHGQYLAWRDLYGGPGIVGENATFASGLMDSFQQGTNVARNKFQSYLREDDPKYNPGSGERSEENEIIRDNVLYPGTAIDYFVTSAYIATPTEYFYLPDTTGGFFSEFEILPSWREDNGMLKYPCLLYIDGFNRGAEFYIENALDVLGLEHDRYDYLDSTSSWKAPMSRGSDVDSNNGCTLPQLIGYRGILVNSGTLPSGLFWEEDYVLWSDWLDAVACESNATMQGFIANGDNMATAMTQFGSTMLSRFLGATQQTYSYHGLASDENYCVQLEAPLVGASYGTSNSQGSYDYDAWGNWCPSAFTFDVMHTSGSGNGNRVYVNVANSDETEWASIANEVVGGSNYRSVIDGVSYHHLSERDAVDECVGDSAHIVTAVYNEIASALEWIFGADPGDIPSACSEPCVPLDVEEPGLSGDSEATRLFQNTPNPFNPRTTLRFTLAVSGPVRLSIHDVSGRQIRTLVDHPMDGGVHEVVWDGTSDAGREVSAGVYWSQLSAGGVDLNRKMLVVK